MDTLFKELNKLCQSSSLVYNDYLNNRHDTVFVDDKTKPIATRIKTAETFYERFEENVARNYVLFKSLEIVYNNLKTMKKKVKTEMKILKNQNDLNCFDKIVEELSEIYDEDFQAKKNVLEEQIKEFENRKNTKISEMKKSKYYKGCDDTELNIGKKTNMIFKEVIFDSVQDDWKQNTSVFNNKIEGKSNLVFLIEDNDGNKFGGVLFEKVKNIEWVDDSKSFIFISKINGKNTFEKYPINDKQTFYLNRKKDFSLFSFKMTSDFGINKNGDGTFRLSSFGGKNKLFIDDKFKVSRIKVIQLE
ncbi:hypothetical protein EIN_303710 [Entamoeba invadens IP1]|uniref:Uncharacterized protein n=1 Tax=Entamoeba invadens IP1 TaxID=370355 RepID=A0A0A1U6A0_ENTIV|nr:hypothetical protein EIN_303710 [Entamoeba invadens IP1]ELP89927.1 hypothetical protein EIN_303710 [Entamoeba invadens IP1]|eukprot:XP_004256698.1 hypothetical protein EIN_303710 [Entamoeba invadens IP1]